MSKVNRGVFRGRLVTLVLLLGLLAQVIRFIKVIRIDRVITRKVSRVIKKP